MVPELLNFASFPFLVSNMELAMTAPSVTSAYEQQKRCIMALLSRGKMSLHDGTRVLGNAARGRQLPCNGSCNGRPRSIYHRYPWFHLTLSLVCICANADADTCIY